MTTNIEWDWGSDQREQPHKGYVVMRRTSRGGKYFSEVDPKERLIRTTEDVHRALVFKTRLEAEQAIDHHRDLFGDSMDVLEYVIEEAPR